MKEALSCVGTAIAEVFNIFQYLLDNFGFTFVLVGFFTIFTVSRLLLAPLIGGIFSAGVSDKVAQYKKTGKYDPARQKGNKKRG